MLRGFLVHAQPKFRNAAIRGIARIAKEEAVDELVRFLRDRSPSVVREAKKQLEPFLNAVSGETLLAIVREGDTEYVRRCALQSIFDKGKWQSLAWLIRAASFGDKATTFWACRFIEAWFSPPLCNKVFSKPSVAERTAIKEAMSAFPKGNSEEFFAKLQKWLQDR